MLAVGNVLTKLFLLVAIVSAVETGSQIHVIVAQVSRTRKFEEPVHAQTRHPPQSLSGNVQHEHPSWFCSLKSSCGISLVILGR